MLLTEKSLALHETVNQMGFGSLEDFALEKAKETLIKEVSNCMRRTAIFSDKYGMNYTEFCKNFHELSFPLFEKEEDSAEWNAELVQTQILLERLARLD
jgi:hypothetical protein